MVVCSFRQTSPDRPCNNSSTGKFVHRYLLQLLFALPLLVLGLRLDAEPALAQTGPEAPICNGVSAMPPAECNALVALYQATDGANWLNHSNWLTVNVGISPCQWYGVVCENGHVTQLMLSQNELRGLLPGLLGTLPQLRQLQLADNHLTGNAPLALCELIDTIQFASFNDNQLTAENAQIAQCLNQLDPDWAATQTVAPREIRPTTIMTNSIQLLWTPIRYTGDGGFYEISYATSITGTYTVHGQTADKSANGYLLNNLAPGQPYYIRVRTYTPAHNGHPEQSSLAVRLQATTAATTGNVLLIIFFPADNDLSPYVESIIQRVRIGTALNPNVRVVMLTDRSGDHNTTVFEAKNGIVTPTQLVREQWGTDELDTTDPQVLTWFLKLARQRYPASRTLLSLMGHGAGLAPEYADTTAVVAAIHADPLPGVPALPRGVDMTPGDVTNDGGYLSTLDFAQALAAATDNGANPFDVIFFDQCFQGNLDVLYEVRNSARVFVASPNYAWLAAPYHKYLPELTPTATPELMANAITHIYQAALTDREPNVIFWLRSAEIVPIFNAVSDLGVALQSATARGEDNWILTAALNSLYVDTTQCGRGNMKLGPPDEMLGAGSFARNLQRAFAPGDPDGVNAAAANVLTALANVHKMVRTGRPYIAPETFWNYEDTLTLLAPLARNLPAAVVWRASIYKETVPLTAVWSATPTQTVEIATTFAAVRDGQWDNFIASWYTNPLTPTIGERCQYIPPVLTTAEVTETLRLTVATVGDLVQLSWTPTGNASVIGYWLVAKEAEGVNWTVIESVPITQTTFTVQKPEAGSAYQLAVIAQNEDGVILAQSNALDYSVPVAAVEQRLYLPFVQK